ncbi:MAG: hypothetical protein ACXWUD_13160 [Methylosarcina sp.]
MRNCFLALFFAGTALAASSAYAEIINKDAIPEEVLTHFYKKHPDTVDLSARKKNISARISMSSTLKRAMKNGLNSIGLMAPFM